MKKLALFVVIVTGAGLWAGERSADAGPNGFGIRGGLTADYSTVFFGGHGAIHLNAAPRLRLEPSLELLVDDDVDFVELRFNFNFKYLVPLGRRSAVYPLFGPALVAFGGRDADIGINLGGGFGLSGFLFDLAIGIGDIPNVTFTIGYTFW